MKPEHRESQSKLTMQTEDSDPEGCSEESASVNGRMESPNRNADGEDTPRRGERERRGVQKGSELERGRRCGGSGNR